MSRMSSHADSRLGARAGLGSLWSRRWLAGAPRHGQPQQHTVPGAAPLHSAQWFRVAHLRPLLQAQVQVQRQVLRGAVWHTLRRADGRGQRHFRINAGAWSALARCNGTHTLQQVWDMALAEAGPQAPSQDEWLAMLARLHEAGLVSFDRSPDFGARADADGAALRGSAARHAPNPSGANTALHRQSLLAWRMPLGNPDVLLQRLLGGLGRADKGPALPRGTTSNAFVSKTALLLWLAVVLAGAWAAALHASELQTLLPPLLAAPQTWGFTGLAYPLLKLVHEAAHGLAARRCGAAVPQWGITWLMGVPVAVCGRQRGLGAAAAAPAPAGGRGRYCG